MINLFALITVIMQLPCTFWYLKVINILIQVHKKNWLHKVNIKGGGKGAPQQEEED